MADKPDCEFITPPNHLRAKVKKGIGPDLKTIVAEAEAALDDLKEGYEAQVTQDLAELAQLIEKVKAQPEAGLLVVEQVYNINHDIKGQAATFGYPLLAEIAQSMCHLIARNESAVAQRLHLVTLHLDAMQVVIAQKVRGEGGEIGKKLTNMLKVAVEKALGT